MWKFSFVVRLKYENHTIRVKTSHVSRFVCIERSEFDWSRQMPIKLRDVDVIDRLVQIRYHICEIEVDIRYKRNLMNTEEIQFRKSD